MAERIASRIIDASTFTQALYRLLDEHSTERYKDGSNLQLAGYLYASLRDYERGLQDVEEP